MEDLPLHKVSISGPTLSSLINRFTSSPSNTESLLFSKFSLHTPFLRRFSFSLSLLSHQHHNRLYLLRNSPRLSSLAPSPLFRSQPRKKLWSPENQTCAAFAGILAASRVRSLEPNPVVPIFFFFHLVSLSLLFNFLFYFSILSIALSLSLQLPPVSKHQNSLTTMAAEITKYRLVPKGNIVTDFKSHFSLFNTRNSTTFVYGVVFIFIAFTVFIGFSPSSSSSFSSSWFFNLFSLNNTSPPFNDESLKSHLSPISSDFPSNPNSSN